MKSIIRNLFLSCLVSVGGNIYAQKQSFPWPDGKKMALSLTFDDARESQATKGAPLLDEYGVKGTFYLVPSTVRKQLDGWKKATANGHEMGNHSLDHRCSGNFVWSRNNALEDYSVTKMRAELLEAGKQIEQMLGVKAVSYAYPCGQKFVGRGRNTQSLVPLVTELFVTGRGWMDEAPVDPGYCDMAQLTGVEMDGKDFEQILPLIEAARKNGQWLVLGGHETNDSGNQTTRLAMLRKLCAYAKDPANGIWITTVGEVATHVNKVRKTLPEIK